MAGLEHLLNGLKAAAEPTRLRLLALCARAELSVTDLTQILGQSQPRVSRHLKLLAEAGLIDRFREGTFAFFRLAERGEAGRLARRLVEALPPDDPTLALDRSRLDAVMQARAEKAMAYFRANAPRWHEIRSLHVPEREVESALARLLPARLDDLLDIGTGTGRMLELFAPRAARAVGIDLSREMLSIARANLDRAGLTNAQVRLADMYQVPFAGESFDAVLIHQVLHYAEDPAAALAEAGRVLRPGGTLLIVDFDRHGLDALLTEHAHRRAGFADEEIAHWLRAAGLEDTPSLRLPGDPLTVTIWSAIKRTTPVAADQRVAARAAT